MGKVVGFSGTWKEMAPGVEEEVRAAVRKVFEEGGSIVSGGALGVDYWAIDEAFKLDPSANRLKVILATTLNSYVGRLSAWASKNDHGKDRVDKLIELLLKIEVARPEALISIADIEPENITEEDYLACNNPIVELADELMAFQVNKSTGTQDAIDKMRAALKPVIVRSYTV